MITVKRLALVPLGMALWAVLGLALVAVATAATHPAPAAHPAATSPAVVPNAERSATPNPTPSGPKQLGWGTAYPLHNADNQALFTVNSPQVLDPGEYDFTQYHHYLAFQVHLTGTTGNIDYGEWMFDLRGPDGTTYQPTFTDDPDHPALNTGTVYAGSQANGWVLFDAPTTAITHGGALEILGPLSGVIGVYPF